jgi:hypothetical protein
MWRRSSGRKGTKDPDEISAAGSRGHRALDAADWVR